MFIIKEEYKFLLERNDNIVSVVEKVLTNLQHVLLRDLCICQRNYIATMLKDISH